MTPAELTQWRANPLRAAVPAVAIDGTRLFANYLGYVFALDLAGGKMLWRSASFHHLEVSAMQDQARALDPSRFAIVASGDYVWTLGRDLKEQNFLAPFRLTCRRAEGGEVVWQSTDLPDYAGLDLVGPPLLAGGKLFIAAKSQANPQQQGQPQQTVLAIQPHDGKVIWKTEVGTFRQGQQYYYYGYREPSAQPQLVLRAGALYVDTHVGVLARLDAESGALDWGYGYQTDHVQGQGRFFFFGDSYAVSGGDDGQQSAAPGRRVPPDQGDAVRPPLRGRAGPDEGRLGPADREVVAAARRRRPCPHPRRPRDQRPGPEDAGPALGDARPRRQHRAGASSSVPTASGN